MHPPINHEISGSNTSTEEIKTKIGDLLVSRAVKCSEGNFRGPGFDPQRGERFFCPKIGKNGSNRQNINGSLKETTNKNDFIKSFQDNVKKH